MRADGTLIAAETRGSIHQVGAQVQGAPACNGWVFWHFQDAGKKISIDVLRQQVRAELSLDARTSVLAETAVTPSPTRRSSVRFSGH